jgi:DNA polymerase delta subunit 2
MDNRLDIAEHTLKWAHIAPTCPDTLWGYPFKSADPFVLEEAPHVYFIGNQPAFESRIVEGNGGAKTLIVLVPSFEKSGEFVMMNTRTQEVRCINVDVSDLDGDGIML